MPSTLASKKLVAVTVTLAVLATLTVPLAGSAVANHGGRTLEIGNCSTNPPPGSPCPDTNADIMANEVDSNQVQQTHTIRAVLRNADGTADAPADVTSGPINIDFEIESGPGDPDNGNNPIPPDLTCSVPIGATSCEVQYSSSQTGSNTIRAWIDHDQNNNQVVNDPYDGTEGRFANTDTDCGTPPPDPPTPPTTPADDCNPVEQEELPQEGATPEPDGTDVIEKSWGPGPAARLDCELELATNPSTGNGSSETYTCTVTDALGNPISGIPIDGENLGGANDPDNSAAGGPASLADYDHQNPNETTGNRHFCVTGSNGQCSDTVDAIDAEAGSADICFWPDDENTDEDAALEGDGIFDPGGAVNDGGDCDLETQGQNDADLTDTVTKTWQVRSPAQGGVDAEPETDTNDITTDHVITATVYDQFGAPFQGNTTVNFEFFSGSPNEPPNDGNTPSSPDGTCTTSNASSCQFSYPQGQAPAKVGTDLLCVWINSAPTMSGNNTSGTCDGGNGHEGLNDPDDAPGTADPPEPANDDVDVVQKIWQDPASASRLDCAPETDTNPVGTAHTITCTATNAAGTGISGVNIDGEATGTNDPDSGNSPTSPDFTCNTASNDPTTPMTNEEGTCTFTHGPGGTGTTNSPGLTTYRFWIDSDKDNATTEADDSEGRDETATAGSRPEPDDTDVVEKSWVAAPASLTMTPESDTANVGTCNAYTITVLNAQNQPAQGATIDVEQRHERALNSTQNDEPRVSFCTPTTADGPNPSTVDEGRGDLRPPDENPDNVGTAGGETVNPTDAQGKVTIGIRVEAANNSDGTGTVNLSAFFETTDNDDPDSGEPQDTSTKTWQKTQPRTIDCTPNSATNPVGTQHVVTCTVRDSAGQPVPGEGVTFTENGPGTISPTQATTDQNGQARTTATSSETGQQTITGTITADTVGNEPSEVDECDRAAGDPSGAPAGQCSDSVTKTWTTSQARAIDCEPETDSNPTGTEHVVTCTVRNAAGQPAAGEGVTFTETGPGTISPTQATTDQSGQARTTATSTEAGTQTITGTITADTQGAEPGEVDECDRAANDPQGAVAGACADSVEKTWTQDQPECSDGIDNDGDGRIDFPADRGCTSAQDDSEASPRGAEACEEEGSGGRNVIIGTDGDDVLTGTNGADLICAAAGDDVVDALGGRDLVLLGAGDDTGRGGRGKDAFTGAGGADTIHGHKGNDSLKGNVGNDTLKGNAGVDTLSGGRGADSLQGGNGEDVLKGGKGGDTLRGGKQADLLDGGKGRDRCFGGRGRDDLARCE